MVLETVWAQDFFRPLHDNRLFEDRGLVANILSPQVWILGRKGAVSTKNGEIQFIDISVSQENALSYPSENRRHGSFKLLFLQFQLFLGAILPPFRCRKTPLSLGGKFMGLVSVSPLVKNLCGPRQSEAGKGVIRVGFCQVLKLQEVAIGRLFVPGGTGKSPFQAQEVGVDESRPVSAVPEAAEEPLE